jgi:hypothetical protein
LIAYYSTQKPAMNKDRKTVTCAAHSKEIVVENGMKSSMAGLLTA